MGGAIVFGPPYHLLLCSGQSNTFSAGPTSVPPEIASLPRVWIYNGTLIVPYVAGSNSSPDGGALANKWGPEAQYAKRWLADNPTGSLIIVKRPRDGTRIATWQIGLTNFDTMTTWVNATKAALGEAPASVAALWLQGESDAIVDQSTANAYEAALTTLLASIRSEWGTP